MITTIDTEKRMSQTLFTHLSENVWNTPLLERRRNIRPMSFNNGRAAVNTVDLGCRSVDLPYKKNLIEKKAFYVFGAAGCCMGGLNIDVNAKSLKTSLANYYDCGWLPLDKYLNARPFDIRVHGINGEWLYRGDIYITNHPYQDMFLLAVEVKMAEQILGRGYDYTKIWISVYYDSDNDLNNLQTTSQTITCYHPVGSDLGTLNAAYEAYALVSDEIPTGKHVSPKGQTLYFIDGRESTPSSLSDISFGQYIEVVYDPDIIYDLYLDLTKVGENNIYRSPLDDTYKYIVHIPKAVNPDNYIITHNTCDIFQRPTNTSVNSDERLKGLFIHRFNTSIRRADGQLVDHMISQITHNDFGISEKLLMARMGVDVLNTTECILRVVVRRHSKTKQLSEDANFIKLLYNFNDDEQILKHLTGHGEKSLSFWRAENLEQSNFSKMLVNLPVYADTNNTQYLVDSLGYFNSLCVVTPRVTHKKFSDINSHYFDVSIPESMLSSSFIGLLVYVNGKKLDNELFSYERKYQYLRVHVDNSVPLTAGDYLSFELLDGETLKGKIVQPTSEDPALVLYELMDFDIYEVINEGVDESVADYYTKNYLQNPGPSYAKQNPDDIFQGNVREDKESGTFSYVFNQSCYGKTYVVLSKLVCARFDNTEIEIAGGNVTFGGVETTTGDTCTDLMHSGVLHLTVEPLPGYPNDENFTIPIINTEWNTIVFLNNKEQVRDIDFTFKPVMGKNGIKSMVWFFNCNNTYLNKTNNKFEMFLTSDKEFMNFTGFMHNRYRFNGNTGHKTYDYGVIEEVTPYIYWFERLCTGAIDGLNRNDIVQRTGYLMADKECRQGGLYYTRGLIPLETKEFIDKFSDIDNDLTKLSAIAEYRKKHAPELDVEIEVIPHSHHITSITMNAVVKDVLTGKLQLAYESDPYMMLRQLEDYTSLRKYDAAMSGVAKELTIYNAGYIRANNRYRLEDISMVGINRKWKNNSNNIVIWWNCDDDKYRWEISVIEVLGKTTYYYADDPTGTKDPWDLDWNFVLDEDGVPLDKNRSLPKFESGSIDLRYLDLFPSYSSDLQTVMNNITLRQAMKALFPIDSVKDGDTTV